LERVGRNVFAEQKAKKKITPRYSHVGFFSEKIYCLSRRRRREKAF
jgi:hypothetical protein